MFCCFLLFPRERVPLELKIHVLHVSLLIIAMISPYSKTGAPFGEFQVHSFVFS